MYLDTYILLATNKALIGYIFLILYNEEYNYTKIIYLLVTDHNKSIRALSQTWHRIQNPVGDMGHAS